MYSTILKRRDFGYHTRQGSEVKRVKPEANFKTK